MKEEERQARTHDSWNTPTAWKTPGDKQGGATDLDRKEEQDREADGKEREKAEQEGG